MEMRYIRKEMCIRDRYYTCATVTIYCQIKYAKIGNIFYRKKDPCERKCQIWSLAMTIVQYSVNIQNHHVENDSKQGNCLATQMNYWWTKCVPLVVGNRLYWIRSSSSLSPSSLLTPLKNILWQNSTNQWVWHFVRSTNTMSNKTD